MVQEKYPHIVHLQKSEATNDVLVERDGKMSSKVFGDFAARRSCPRSLSDSTSKPPRDTLRFPNRCSTVGAFAPVTGACHEAARAGEDAVARNA